MKNFNDIYQKIYDSCNKGELELARHKQLKQTWLITGIILATFIGFMFFGLIEPKILLMFTALFPIVFILLIVIFIVKGTRSTKDNKNSYLNMYKDEVISRLVNYYDEHLTFERKKSIQKIDYIQGEFEYFDTFHSDDYISGDLEGKTYIQMGDVLTQTQHTDSEGHTTYVTVFRGLYCMCNLNKNTNNKLKVRNDKGFLGKMLKNKELVQMDSQEFEKNFDVYCTDKILAMRLLTSDIMDYMINFKRENKVKFDFTVKNDIAYIRINCANMFEGALTKDALDYEILLKYFKYLDFMCQLSLMISKVISEKDL